MTPPPSMPPTTAERIEVPSTSRPLAALQQRPADREPEGSALLVPGYTGSKEDFAFVLDLIAEAGYVATAIDQRGQYESPWADGGDPSAYAFDRLAADVVTVAASLPGPVHLVGHSLGGLVARRAVLAAPAAFATLTLLASGPAGLVDARLLELQDLLDALPTTDTGTLFDSHQQARRRLGRPLPGPELTAFLRARAIASCPHGLLAMGKQLRDEDDLVDDLRATGVPVLVLLGENDNAWSPALQADMAHRLGAAHSVIAGAAHSPAAERPSETAEALHAFWRATSANLR